VGSIPIRHPKSLEVAMAEEDYPGQQDEIRRERIIRNAVEAADRLIMDGSNGDVEETDYLTGAVALKFVEKVQGRLQAQLWRANMLSR
jgi:hypothetical protein